MRAKATTEESKKGDKISIVITEIPFQVNKKRLLENIADLVREKTIEGISDLRDESDRDGMRIVIELKRGEVPEVILNNLYKHTQLQTTFGIIMLAIVGGRPRVLPLVDIIEHFIEFRREVVRRRTEFELRKAEARAHILEGLRIALDHLDAVIKLIRGSKNPLEARAGLMTEFGLSQLQAQAILDMQLQRLTGLERQKILDELAELMKTIERLRAILSSDALLMGVVMGELVAVRDKFSDERRTTFIEDSGEFRVEDLIVDEDVAITVTNTGYIKRTAISTYRMQRRGGKGRIGMRTREEDFVSHLFIASTHSYIMIFTDRGRAYWLKVHEVPDAGAGGKGKAIANLVSMQEGEKIASLLAVKEFPTEDDQQFVVMGTRKGVIKKTDLWSSATRARAASSRWASMMTMRSSRWKCPTASNRSSLAPATGWRFGSRSQRSLDGSHRLWRPRHHAARRRRSSRDGSRPPWRNRPDGGENGYGKRTALDEYRITSRGGNGIINIQTTDRNGQVVGMPFVNDDDQVMLISQFGMILRMRAGDVARSVAQRQGVRLIEMEEGDMVVAVAKLAEKYDEGEGEAPVSDVPPPETAGE